MKQKKSVAKDYIAIVKLANNKDGTAHCVKYRFNNLLKFTRFLDREWSSWKWYNVFSNRGTNKGMQLASFTNRNRPTRKTLSN